MQEEKAEETAEDCWRSSSLSRHRSKQAVGDSGMFTADEVNGQALKDMHTRHEKERRDMHTRHEGEHKAMASRMGKTAPEDKGKSGTEANLNAGPVSSAFVREWPAGRCWRRGWRA